MSKMCYQTKLWDLIKEQNFTIKYSNFAVIINWNAIDRYRSEIANWCTSRLVIVGDRIEYSFITRKYYIKDTMWE